MWTLPIKHYTPNATTQSARISERQWSSDERRIRELHDEGVTRKEALERLRHECQGQGCSFRPS